MNSVGPGHSWRLVYDAENDQVINIIESSGYTSSAYAIAEFATEELLLAFIDEHSLKMPPSQDNGETEE